MNKTHVAIHLAQVSSRATAQKTFPLLYMWFKDYYYQKSHNYDNTTWSYVDCHEPIEETEYFDYLEKNPPSVFAISLYMWNSDVLLQNALAVKQRFPECIIVAGGPSAEATVDFMQSNQIDLVILGPGTEIFRRIVDAVVTKQKLTDLAGVACLDNNTVQINSALDKREDPLIVNYVNNFREETISILDSITNNKTSQATFLSILMQGCPYTCSFCEQGTSQWTKISKRPVDHVIDELTLLTEYPIALRFIDSNFGIIPDYKTIVDYIIAAKKQHPTWDVYLYEPDWAKNTTENIFKMQDNLVTNGVTTTSGMIALQDLDQDVLKLNGRPGATDYKKINFLVANMKKSNQRNPRVDLIFGMPGQSRDSLINTIVQLSTIGILSTPYIYLVFPNTPYGNSLPPGSEVVACTLPNSSYHSLVKDDSLPIKLSYLVKTDSLNTHDLFSMFYICRMLFEMQKDFLLDNLLMYIKKYTAITEEQFYRSLIQCFCESNNDEIAADIEFGEAWLATGVPTQHCSITKLQLNPINVPTYRYMTSLQVVCNIIAKAATDLGVPKKLTHSLLMWEYHSRNSYDHTTTELISYHWPDIINNKSSIYYQSKFVFDRWGKTEIINAIKSSQSMSRDISFSLTSIDNPESATLLQLQQEN